MAALVFKAFTLVLKTAAKPLSSKFSQFVLTHPKTRTRVVALAQILHRQEVWLSRAAEAPLEVTRTSSKHTFVGELTEAKAVALASRVVSEGFIFSVSVGIIAWEYERGQRKDEAKKAAEQAQRAAIHRKAEQDRAELHSEILDVVGRVATLGDRLARIEEQMNKAPVKRSWSIG